MGRLTAFHYLSLEDQERVNKCIRIHQYSNLDWMMSDLKECGVTGFSRGALHRQVLRLKEADALCANPNEGTVVTIIERGSGSVRIIKTSASGLAVATILEKNQVGTLLS